MGSLALRVLAICSAAIGVARATGFLTLESSPTGAEVWYTGPEDPDRKYLGDTPLMNRELPVGKYDFWLILSSHDTLSIPAVYIAEGQTTQMSREIPSHYGYLEVGTDPDSAEIRLDGIRIGPSPYINSLVIPGKYALNSVPREAHLKSVTRGVAVGKGDSIGLDIRAPYRDKSFLGENLSLPPWVFQAEAGIEFRSWTGNYLNEGKREALPTDSADLPSQWDFPIKVRLGLPRDFEVHLLLPFKSSRDPQTGSDSAIFQSNMRVGVTYTYRPLNIGLDLAYGFGFENSSPALDHDYLAITVLGMASKGKIYGQAQAGVEFHFASKADNKFDPGDMGLVHLQVGYLMAPFTPYLGASATYRLDDTRGGKKVEESSGRLSPQMGYLLAPELGFVVDAAEDFSFQFGVPFTVVGKNAQSFWGLHVSASLAVGLL